MAVKRIKYAQRCTIVSQPSMRSLFDQRLRIGLTPSRSATRATRANTVTRIVKLFHFGANCRSRYRRISQSAKASSTMMRKKKALPVMNGKKRLLLMVKGVQGVGKSGKSGTRNNRKTTAFFKKVCDDFMVVGSIAYG